MRAIIVLAALVTLPASAQNNWEDAGMPFQSVGIRQLYVDSVANRLIACGQITLTNNYGAVPLATYANGTWDTLGIFGGWVYSAIRFHDTLIVGGKFNQVNNIPVEQVAAWYDGNWYSYGQFDTEGMVRKLRVINGSLYAVGAFISVDGRTCHGVARRVGGHWENLGSIDYPLGDEPIVLDVCEYQGNIVVGGELNPIGLGNDLIQFDGTNWVNVGDGQLDGVGAVTCLAVYHDELYVGGGLYVGAGSPGHGLVRWDGTEWHDVGGSMRDIYGTTQYNASASSLLVHDDKLLVGGAFGYAGDVHANQFAVWDGNRWCATGDSIGGTVESMAFYHDTLFIACTNTLEGLPANYIGRWTGGAFEQVCGSGTGIGEPPMPQASITVGPSVNGQRAIYGLPVGRYELTLYDALGKQLGTQRVSSSGSKAQMQQPRMAKGLYIIRIQGKAFQGTARFIAEQ